MFYVSGKCTVTRELNHYWGSHREIGDYDHAAMNYCKKCFRTQKSDKTAGFGSDIGWIRIRQIRNSKVPIPNLYNSTATRGKYSAAEEYKKYHVTVCDQSTERN